MPKVVDLTQEEETPATNYNEEFYSLSHVWNSDEEEERAKKEEKTKDNVCGKCSR